MSTVNISLYCCRNNTILVDVTTWNLLPKSNIIKFINPLTSHTICLMTNELSSPTVIQTFSAANLLQILRDGEPRTRAELVAVTGLARSTVGLRIDELIAMGLVNAVEETVFTGGRPSMSIVFQPQARLILAADIGARYARLAVTDLRSQILAYTSARITVLDGPENLLSWVIEQFKELLASIDKNAQAVAAIGIGLPAPIEHTTGKPVLPPIMPGWDGYDVSAYLRTHFDVPVLVEKDVNIMVLGEKIMRWSDADNLILVKMATGIGTGIIANGHLIRGDQGIAGDIGHIQISRAAGVPCHCGNMGCVEAVASAPALARSLRALGHQTPDGKSIIELVRAGELDAIQAIRQAGRDMGEVLAACVSMFNPSTIVVGGILAEAGEHLLAGVREVVYARAMPLATQHLTIVPSEPESSAGIVGASMIAIDHILSPEMIHRLTWR